MTEHTYHNATHLLATPDGTQLRCHVLGRRGDSLHVRLCPKNATGAIDVFVDPRRVTGMATNVEDLL